MKQFLILVLLLSTTHAFSQLRYVNKNSSSAMPKLEIINGKTMIYDELNGAPVLFHTWNQIPVKFESNYSHTRYRMTVTVTTSMSKRTYYIEHTNLSGAGENKGKTDGAYVKLTIDYFDKNRKDKVLEEYFTRIY